jgi:hypothetical protein
MLILPRVVCGSTAYHLAHLVVRSSLAIWVLVSGGGPGALLVSLFNVKWRCSVQGGHVEGSKFCLFSVALPARCVSSISPRFHFRKHAVCFFPLAAILESPFQSLLIHSKWSFFTSSTVKLVFIHLIRSSVPTPPLTCEKHRSSLSSLKYFFSLQHHPIG